MSDAPWPTLALLDDEVERPAAVVLETDHLRAWRENIEGRVENVMVEAATLRGLMDEVLAARESGK